MSLRQTLSEPFIIMKPHLQMNYQHFMQTSLRKGKRKIKTARESMKRKVYNSYDSKCPKLVNPNNWDSRISTPFNSERNSMYLTGIDYANENKHQFILQDFSKYKRTPESYLPKYEIEKLFLEKISAPLRESKSYMKLKPKKSQLCYALGKQFQCRTVNSKSNVKEVNEYSCCDVNYLRQTNPHILKMKRLQEEFYRLRKNQPLAIVPGFYAIKKINEDNKRNMTFRRSNFVIGNNNYKDSMKNATVQTTNQTNET